MHSHIVGGAMQLRTQQLQQQRACSWQQRPHTLPAAAGPRRRPPAVSLQRVRCSAPPSAAAPAPSAPAPAAAASDLTTTTSSSSKDAASSSSKDASSSGSAVTDAPPLSFKAEAQQAAADFRETYDRLIAIFQARPRDEWRKLITFSKQWPQHKQGVFDRLRGMADESDDVDAKMRLRRLFRALQGVDAEVARYEGVLQKFLDAKDDEWEAVVAVYRGDLQKPFFEHMQCLVIAAKDDPPRKERLVLVNTRLLALCTAHDSVAADEEKLAAAAEVYRDLLSSISSIEEADARMEALAAAGKIDPAFLQITAKAYGAARDTNMTLDEAKWVSYRLYVRARDYFDRQQPAEKRILEYLVAMRDRAERSRQLDAAVTPGPTRFTDSHDYLWTTPARLYAVLDGTLRAYDAMQGAAAQRMGASGEATTPWKVTSLRELRDEIRRRYL